MAYKLSGESSRGVGALSPSANDADFLSSLPYEPPFAFPGLRRGEQSQGLVDLTSEKGKGRMVESEPIEDTEILDTGLYSKMTTPKCLEGEYRLTQTYPRTLSLRQRVRRIRQWFRA
jgi:hypothetical protein